MKKKKIKEIFLFGFIIVIILVLLLLYKYKEKTMEFIPSLLLIDKDNISAQAYGVIDLKTGRMLAAKGEKEQVKTASLAKLFSIHMVNGLKYMDSYIEISQDNLDLVGHNSSMSNLLPGTYFLENIYHAILAPSGNDAMYALADNIGKDMNPELETCQDRLDEYTQALNKFIKEEGFLNTSIKDVTGYYGKTYSCVEDLSKLSQELLKKKWFRNMTGQYQYLSRTPSGKSLVWDNTNKFLNPDSKFYNPNIHGIKTGSLENYKNIISLYEDEQSSLLIIVIGSKTDDLRYEDTLNLIEKYK